MIVEVYDMKRSNWSILVLAGAILVSAILVTAGLFFRPGAAPSAADPPAGQLNAETAYRLEKLNEVNDMVLAREVVPEDYLRYLPEELLEPVKQYNADTAGMRITYGQEGSSIAAWLLYEHREDPGDYVRGDLFYAMADRISTLSLYRNVSQLCPADPILSYTLAKEAGGSYGAWAYYIQRGSGYDEDMIQLRLDYLDSVDRLLDQFEDARAAMTTNPDKD